MAQSGAASAAPRNPRPDEARGYERHPGPQPADVALWLPRALLYLPRMAIGLAVLPIRGAIHWLGKHTSAESGPPRDDDNASFFVWPELSHQSWMGPTLGIFVGRENLAGSDERLELAARVFGEVSHDVSLGFSGDQVGGSPLWLETRTEYEARPRDVYQGIGNATNGFVRTRYRQRHGEVSALVGVSRGAKGNLTRCGLRSTLTEREFDADAEDADPRIDTVYDIAAIPGFQSGVQSIEERAEIVVDTRNARAATSNGVLLSGFAGGVPPTNGFSYGHFGAAFTEFFNLYRGTRVLRLHASFEQLSGERQAIPFSALATLGGPSRLRGYALERFRDTSAALGMLEYRYQFHAAAAGALFVEAGRVAHGALELLDDSPWHVSGGVGIRVQTEDHSYFSLDVAYGDSLALYFTTAPNGVAP